jgi:hypothetical protein
MPRDREEGQREQSKSRNIGDFAQVHEDHLSNRCGSRTMPVYRIGDFSKIAIALLSSLS